MSQSFRSKKGYAHPVEVDEGDIRNLKFFPISPLRLTGLRDAFGTVLKSLGGLVKDDNQLSDNRVTRKTEGEFIEIVTEPTAVDTLRFRQKQREDGLEGMMNVLLHKENMVGVALVIMDSLREEFTREGNEDEASDKTRATAFLSDTDLPVIVQMIHGVIKANKKVFAPLGQKLAAAAKAAGFKLPVFRAPTESPSDPPTESLPNLRAIEAEPSKPLSD